MPQTFTKARLANSLTILSQCPPIIQQGAWFFTVSVEVGVVVQVPYTLTRFVQTQQLIHIGTHIEPAQSHSASRYFLVSLEMSKQRV